MELEIIKDLVCQVTGADPRFLTEDTSFSDDLGTDSLDIFQIIMAIEEQFEVEIPDSTAESIVTIGDIAQIVADIRSKNNN